MARVVIVDIETTGFNTDSCKIIELAAIQIDTETFEVKGEFNSLINPMCAIPLRVSQLTGITEDMITDEATIYDVFDEFTHFIGDLPLVGHKIVNCDLPFLNNVSLEIDGVPFDNEVIDTLPLIRKKIKLQSYSLENLAQTTGHVYEAHRALNDCKALLHIIKHFGLLEV